MAKKTQSRNWIGESEWCQIDHKWLKVITHAYLYTNFRAIQTYVVNFTCQKVQNFWADSDSLGKINDKKIFKIFFFNV
mgnify:CR=1 FL=1